MLLLRYDRCLFNMAFKEPLQFDFFKAHKEIKQITRVKKRNKLKFSNHKRFTIKNRKEAIQHLFRRERQIINK